VALNPEKVDLDGLRVFDLVMRTGTLSDAARAAECSTAVASRALSKLSQQLGAELFTNTGHGMLPTEFSRRIEAGVRTGIGHIRQALMIEPTFAPATSKRRFSRDIPVGGHTILAPMILPYLEKHAPGIELVMSANRAGDVWPQLQAGELDLALDNVEMRHEDARSVVLYEDPFVVIARKNHPAIARHGMTREVFQTVKHVTVSWSRVTQESPITERLKQLGMTRNSPYFVPSIASIPGIVESTDFIAMLSRRTAPRVARRWAIEVHECPFDFKPVPIYGVWHSRWDADPGHACLRNLIVKIADEI
jgi:LysR family transcriptional activator for leuABCD operon